MDPFLTEDSTRTQRPTHLRSGHIGQRKQERAALCLPHGRPRPTQACWRAFFAVVRVTAPQAQDPGGALRIDAS